jgi:hypothetical protein
VDPVEDRHVRTHPRSGNSDSAGAVAAAVDSVLVLLEQRRRQSIRDSASRRPSQRYEELCLAAAIARLERHLRVAEEVTDWEGVRYWVEDLLADRSAWRGRSSGDAAWLSARARRRANARARRRFEAMATEVLAELERRQQLSELAKVEPGTEPARCIALTRRGTRCKNRAETDGLCGLHSQLAAKGVAEVLVVR